MAIVENDGTEKVLGSAFPLLPWWSFTKTVLANCSLRLAEEGLIDLDEVRPASHSHSVSYFNTTREQSPLHA